MSDPQNIAKKNSSSQVTVCVKLYDFFARMAPEAEFNVNVVAGSTIADFIGLLSERLGDDFCKAIVDRNGHLHGGIAVVINKRFIHPSQLAKITLTQKSNLSIIPLAGGG